MSFKSGSSSSTERSSQSFAPWTQEGQQDVAGSAFNMANNFLRASPFARAAMTADQLRGMDMSRVSAKDAFLSGGNLLNPRAEDANMLLNLPALTGERNAKLANAAQVGQAAQIDGSQIQGLMNPYLANVADSTIRRMRGERDQTAAQIGARAAAGGSFGGSREAVQRAQLDRNFGNQVGDTVSNLMSQGYDRATQAALNNAQMRQQTGLADAGFRQQAEMSNRDAQNRVSSENLDAWLKAPQINSQLLDANQRRQLQAAQAIMAGGNQQQAFSQSVLDAPWTALGRLQGTIPQVYDNNRVTNKETESSEFGFNPMSFMTGAVNLMKASDEGLKTNKEKIGKDPQTGLLMWAYDYKSDVEKSKKTGKPMPAKRVGPMAQEVEQKYPGSTKKIDGKMMIDMGLLSKMLAKNGK